MAKNVKIGFLFSVNACAFIPMMLFYGYRITFLFSINAYVFISMVLFYG